MVVSGPNKHPRAKKIEKVEANDLQAARELLSKYDLPTDGLDETELWCVRSDDDGIIGIAGLETWGKQGLLRSVVVKEGNRNGGMGQALVRRILEEAKARGIAELYLLTETASSFFGKFGFEGVDRSTVKGGVLDSIEFKEACRNTPPMKLVLNKRS